MRYEMYTVRREDIASFESALPDYVLDNCDRKGCFMIGAVDQDMNLIGMTQFYIGMREEEFISNVIYVYVDEAFRRQGAASGMLDKVHSILKKSGIAKSLAFLDRKQPEKDLFTDSGYLFMPPDKEAVEELAGVNMSMSSPGMEQGVYWLDR
ncbi:MAG: GNAT family N-acetyltransferase [Lachnospiraceae bacterium]|nr:GNAT family N-acetyltransferase [Lachnospiraceae bacterium]